MFKPKATKIEARSYCIPRAAGAAITPSLTIINGKVNLMDSFGQLASGIDARDIVMMAEVLKLGDKSLTFFCVEHGHFGAQKGARQIPSCYNCLERQKQEAIDEQGSDDEG